MALRRFAAASPAGPEPTMPTFMPLRPYLCGCTYPSLNAASIMAASSSLIVTGASIASLSTQLFSQSAGQMRPVNSGKSFVAVSIS